MFSKTVGQRGRHARTGAKVNQARITQGQARKKEKSMIEEAVRVVPGSISIAGSGGVASKATRAYAQPAARKMFRIGKN